LAVPRRPSRPYAGEADHGIRVATLRDPSRLCKSLVCTLVPEPGCGFALDGTHHTSHKEQASMIRRYIIWRNNHAYDKRLRRVADRANVA
jgi:hypothetical protein